ARIGAEDRGVVRLFLLAALVRAPACRRPQRASTRRLWTSAASWYAPLLGTRRLSARAAC
ncbi:hypothetical protein, partial [Nonomuraea deserti]|uniref:hypothetical protein n=1 Tax=Nonomuraea deserti TaxID=1848322 RepID=UPI001C707B37